MVHTEIKQMTRDWDEAMYAMFQEIPAEENGFINGGNVSSPEKFMDYLDRCVRDAEQQGVMDGWRVPQTTYVFYVEGMPVGVAKVRHELTEKLRAGGGHVGYAIRPTARGKGYGRMLLREVLGQCKRMGIDRVLLTVHVGNEPSLRVALANGGVLEKIENNRYYIWIDTSV